MSKRDYSIEITINKRKIDRVVIDDHYKTKHSDSMSDELILQLVSLLDGGIYPPAAEKDGFQYFKTEPLILEDKAYRLIWLLEENEIYIGIVNAFRR